MVIRSQGRALLLASIGRRPLNGFASGLFRPRVAGQGLVVVDIRIARQGHPQIPIQLPSANAELILI
jgi:hypothetical protein